MKLFILIPLFISTIALAKENALFEIGTIGVAASLFDYPAADHSRIRTILLPLVVYRGEVLKNDNNGGTRAQFFNIDNIILDMSFSASLPATSKENKTRKGMDDLDLLSEIGPRLSFNFIKKNNNSLKLSLPLRLVFSTDFQHTEQRGYRFSPSLNYARNKFWIKNLTAYSSLTISYGAEELNDYFYEVTDKDVGPQRNRYNARSGYIGSDYRFGLTYKMKKVNLFTGLQHSSFYNSVNKNSPLYKLRQYYTAVIGFTYYFYESEERIK